MKNNKEVLPGTVYKNPWGDLHFVVLTDTKNVFYYESRLDMPGSNDFDFTRMKCVSKKTFLGTREFYKTVSREAFTEFMNDYKTKLDPLFTEYWLAAKSISAKFEKYIL